MTDSGQASFRCRLCPCAEKLRTELYPGGGGSGQRADEAEAELLVNTDDLLTNGAGGVHREYTKRQRTAVL